jgi:hypothetical protein
MLQILDLFRISYGGRPLLLTMAVVLLLAFTARVVPSLRGTVLWQRTAILAVVVAGFAGLLAYPSLAVWYAADSHFFDNAEPTIVSVAWIYQMGAPLYHDVDSAERYSHIYGPVVFMAHGAALKIFGPSIDVSKWLGAFAGFASLAFVFGAVRRCGSTARAAALTGGCAMLLLLFRHYSFWTRPDSLQLLCAAMALYFAGAHRTRSSVLLVGIASGALWNLKFTGPLYSLPVFALVHRRFGRRAAGLALVTGVLVAVAPFVLPGVSLINYVDWVRLSGQTGLLLSLLRQNLEWAAFLTLPLLLARRLAARKVDRESDQREIRGALLLGLTLVVIAASKPGAGPYHLIPYVPVVVYLVAESLQRSPLQVNHSLTAQTAVAYVVVLAVLATVQAAQLVTTMLPRRALHDVDDIRRFLAGHPGRVEMAYGRTEALSLERPELTFRNNSYLIDQPAVREYQLQGLALPQQTIEAVRHCRVNYWLVPKGERPFSGIGSYPSVFLKPLYPAVLQEAFAATHRLTEETEYYDVWKCMGPGTRNDR